MSQKPLINDIAEVPAIPPEFKAKFAEFRDNNRSLNAKVSELEARLRAFDGIDPDAARAALKELAETGVVDEDAENKRMTDLEAQLVAERAAHNSTRLRAEVSVEFLRLGGRESAVDFIVARAAEVFAVQDGKVTSKAFSTDKPGEPLTLSEWMEAQCHVSDFAFRGSRGAGATGSTGAPARKTVSRDPLEFGRNLADIAAGKVDVV